MHASAYAQMRLCVDTYLHTDRHYRVLELGSRRVARDHLVHRTLFDEYDVDYVGADVAKGGNVDILMEKPYRIPAKSNSFDVVLSGQVLEHVAFPFVSFLEVCRVVKPGGFVFITVPSRGHKHGSPDLWRFYADSMRAFAAYARMDLREVYSDLPPIAGGRIDYAAIDPDDGYWGDTVGVFQKPRQYSKLVAVVREVTVWWANRVGGVDDVTPPAALPQRLAAVRTDRPEPGRLSDRAV